ncbi:MAG: hypothetical protein ABIV47_00415 [Roseiflexaceae bacterium]
MHSTQKFIPISDDLDNRRPTICRLSISAMGRRLDGLPLAIELIAARAARLSRLYAPAAWHWAKPRLPAPGPTAVCLR